MYVVVFGVLMVKVSRPLLNPEFVARSSLKPNSLLELSVQSTVIELDVAESNVSAEGGIITELTTINCGLFDDASSELKLAKAVVLVFPSAPC